MDFYYNLPRLPLKSKISIANIIILNTTYGILSDLDENEFPRGENPSINYMKDEVVSPVIIEDVNGKQYKTQMNIWFILCDIYNGIRLKEKLTLKKVLPFTVFIEGEYFNTRDKPNWISKLMTFVGIDIINTIF